MSYEFYKALHILGIALLFISLGGLAGHALNGGTKETNKGRGLMVASHGIGLLLILVAGFGMLAKLGMMSPGSWGGWVHAKITLWIALGAAVALVYRGPALARALWVVVPILAAMAGWLALTKPF